MLLRLSLSLALVGGVVGLSDRADGQAKVDPKKVDPKNPKKDAKKPPRKWNLDSFVKDVSVKPPEEQIRIVTDKLRELNQAFKDLIYAKVENGVVAKVALDTYFVEDISPLRAFEKMQELYAYSSRTLEGKVTDLAPLNGLKLVIVDLNNNGELSDLSPLKGMPLKSLSFIYTSVHSLAPLESCENLEELRFTYAKVTSLKPLKGMKLKVLMAGANKNEQGHTIADLAPIQGMMLKTFHISGASATNFALIKQMPIEDLSVGSTPIADFSVLKELPLKLLDVSRTKFTEKDGLFIKGKSIVELALSETPVKDINFAREMPLERVYCYYCQQLKDIAPLTDKKLTILNISGTAVKELKPIAGAPILRFDCADTPVVNLEPLRGAPIYHLNLASTKKGGSALADLRPLSKLPLQYLYLTNTAVKDLKPLAGNSVHTLYIQGTKVTDFAVLKDAEKLYALWCDYQLPKDAPALKQIKSLRQINGQNAQNLLN
jgi:Leucine-rich repeat (LRR) protein